MLVALRLLPSDTTGKGLGIEISRLFLMKKGEKNGVSHENSILVVMPSQSDRGFFHLGDHLNTCTAHSGAKKAHDWMVDQVVDLFR